MSERKSRSGHKDGMLRSGDESHTFALAFLQFRQAFLVIDSGTRLRLESKGPRSRPFSARCFGRGSELDSDVDWLGVPAEALLSATDGLMVRSDTFSSGLGGIT